MSEEPFGMDPLGWIHSSGFLSELLLPPLLWASFTVGCGFPVGSCKSHVCNFLPRTSMALIAEVMLLLEGIRPTDFSYL